MRLSSCHLNPKICHHDCWFRKHRMMPSKSHFAVLPPSSNPSHACKIFVTPLSGPLTTLMICASATVKSAQLWYWTWVSNLARRFPLYGTLASDRLQPWMVKTFEVVEVVSNSSRARIGSALARMIFNYGCSITVKSLPLKFIPIIFDVWRYIPPRPLYWLEVMILSFGLGRTFE